MAGAARSAIAAAVRTWHAWMSLSWLRHGRPKAPLAHCCCPGTPGRGWGFPAGPLEPGGCSGLSPRQQGKRVLGIPAERGEARHLDLLPAGLTHGRTQRSLPIAGHSPGDGDHAALRSWGPAPEAAAQLCPGWTPGQCVSPLAARGLGLHVQRQPWAHSKHPPSVALAWPGLSVLPPAGGEGRSLQQQQQLGLWVIAGFLTFLALEKMFLDSKEQEESSQVSGYLNLLANTIDNFTHGLAVAASFLVSKKIGLLTTMAILLHEIPHEVGDFAILLRAGFDRWSAAKLQLSTALGGLLGACFAICTQSPKGVEETVACILPFTSGGFLYIALVNVLPDLLEEDDPWHSLQQVLLLCMGIVVMVLFSLFVE
ncbi:zinc transporter ZIP13 isoform X3 [Rousettus aegyptiacus]|uniref:zinc transporter ZIP13 isoform X3 n=1 Tax=Rousettus aegyptiacus TaxID=9407 RepID=UPI00168D2C80|nr:zinc transporter ZIP13 isoform X3 [Rousettus aegyptiacus]